MSSLTKKIEPILKQIIELPNVVWVLFAFLVTYFLFFVRPLFFSKPQIHYFTKYIPDAFITHIGFDLEATVSRIQTWLTTGTSPYADGFIGYPPLSIAVLSPLTLIGYPAYYKLMTGFTVMAYLLAALMIPLLIIPKKNQGLLFLLFITGLFSYGLQFEQERGQFNLLTFTICLLAIYLYHYHPRFRYFAYLLFSLAVQLKVYPVLFVVMFVHDWRDWKNNLKRFLGLGILNFALLFVLGYQLFRDFLKAITIYQFGYESSRYENLSIKAFGYYLSTNPFGFDTARLVPFSGIFFLALVGLALLAVIISAWSKQARGLNPYLLLICTIAALVIPSVSNDYKLSILIAPMILFLGCQPEISGTGKKITGTILITLAALAYWSTLYPAIAKPDLLARNFPALIVILVCATALNFLAPYAPASSLQN